MTPRTFSLWRTTDGIRVPMWCEIVSHSPKSKIVRYRELRPGAPLMRMGWQRFLREARF